MKTPEQIKNIVEDWIKIVDIKYKDESIKNPNVEFLFMIGNNITCYLLKNRHDRISIEVGFNISPEHREKMAEFSIPEGFEFLNDIETHVYTSGLIVLWNAQKEEKIPTALRIQGYLDVENITREKFYKTWDKVNGIGNVSLRKFQIRFGSGGTNTMTSTSTSQTPYG